MTNVSSGQFNRHYDEVFAKNKNKANDAKSRLLLNICLENITYFSVILPARFQLLCENSIEIKKC